MWSFQRLVGRLDYIIFLQIKSMEFVRYLIFKKNTRGLTDSFVFNPPPLFFLKPSKLFLDYFQLL